MRNSLCLLTGFAENNEANQSAYNHFIPKLPYAQGSHHQSPGGTGLALPFSTTVSERRLSFLSSVVRFFVFFLTSFITMF